MHEDIFLEALDPRFDPVADGEIIVDDDVDQDDTGTGRPGSLLAPT